jgi:hypothetical protein
MQQRSSSHCLTATNLSLASSSQLFGVVLLTVYNHHSATSFTLAPPP